MKTGKLVGNAWKIVFVLILGNSGFLILDLDSVWISLNHRESLDHNRKWQTEDTWWLKNGFKFVKSALFMVKNGFSWSKMGFRRRWFQWAKFHPLTDPENQNSNFKKATLWIDTSNIKINQNDQKEPRPWPFKL